MKITDRYKKMALKAEEIQRRWDGRYCSWVWVPHRNWTGLKQNAHEMSDNCVWLPTQEELQEMLAPKNAFWYYMGLDYLNKEMGEVYGPLYAQGYFNDGNEFWLAVVMWREYHKIWDDEKEEWEVVS
ncbi:hypothetical protein DRO48_01585 [Candidatus Bathyarchaeota archaeon]|nr:MAG: hypothetical protein DRO48_01585 [Candidatus Bathyarchaeota archaeon]